MVFFCVWWRQKNKNRRKWAVTWADPVVASFSAKCRETSESIKKPQVSASIAGWFRIRCDIGVRGVSTRMEYLTSLMYAGHSCPCVFPPAWMNVGTGMWCGGNRDLLRDHQSFSQGSSLRQPAGRRPGEAAVMTKHSADWTSCMH